MATALIGSSGFVGTSLLAQTTFDDTYRSTNIAEIEGKDYDLMVCAAAPAAKWKANQEPEADLENLRRLMKHLENVRARRAILISTIDVFGEPIEVYEDTPIDPERVHPYGRHRFGLERFFAERFPESITIRLPGLFGRGLKKNFLYDLIRKPEVLSLTDSRSIFQFYDMSRLWQDIQTISSRAPSVIHMATEPVEAREVASHCLGIRFESESSNGPVRYDMRTRHAALFGAQGHFMQSRNEVLDGIRTFFRSESAIP